MPRVDSADPVDALFNWTEDRIEGRPFAGEDARHVRAEWSRQRDKYKEEDNELQYP